MPQLNAPPSTAPIAGNERVTPAWAQWMMQAWRTLVPERAFYIPTTTDVPTFTPEVRAGFVAMTFREADNKLYIYNETSDTWKGVVLT